MRVYGCGCSRAHKRARCLSACVSSRHTRTQKHALAFTLPGEAQQRGCDGRASRCERAMHDTQSTATRPRCRLGGPDRRSARRVWGFRFWFRFVDARVLAACLLRAVGHASEPVPVEGWLTAGLVRVLVPHCLALTASASTFAFGCSSFAGGAACALMHRLLDPRRGETLDGANAAAEAAPAKARTANLI